MLPLAALKSETAQERIQLPEVNFNQLDNFWPGQDKMWEKSEKNLMRVFF